MKRFLPLTVLVLGAACSDAPPFTGPSAAVVRTAAASATQAVDRRAALVEDAVERIATTFGESTGAQAARGALRAAQAKLASGDDADLRGVLSAVENALDRIEREDPALAADVTAIRLAIAAL